MVVGLARVNSSTGVVFRNNHFSAHLNQQQKLHQLLSFSHVREGVKNVYLTVRLFLQIQMGIAWIEIAPTLPPVN